MKNPEDHYVAQTYLKWFRNQQNKLWVYNKKWLKIKEKTSAQICKEAGGSDNPFLQKDRAIEEYLKAIENGWNKSIELFTSTADSVDFKEYLEAKYIISAYIAYLRFSTPAAVRVQKISLEAQMQTNLKILDSMGEISKPPKGYEFLMKDIEKNIKVDVDGKFPKAMAAGVLIEVAKKTYKSAWMQIDNHSDTPFLTSDNPLCFWYNDSERFPITYLPLTPRTGLLIKPFIDESVENNYCHSEDEIRVARPEFVTLLNEQVIKHAETILISNQISENLLEEIRKFKNWKYDCLINKIPHDKGELVISTLKVTEAIDTD